MTREEAMNFVSYYKNFNNKRKQKGSGIINLSQVQLCSYFTGYTEIYDFEMKEREGYNLT
jgi:hypothetical protein